ncbi:MAG: hypothetical protein ACOY5W_12375 [Pseudomonadota bacterium]
MKKLTLPLFLTAALGAAPVLAHHMAADIVDEDIYAMIDALVADTPHADLNLEELGSGMRVLTVTTPSVDAMADFLDDGGLGYIEELDGETYIDIDIDEDNSATLTVQQYARP